MARAHSPVEDVIRTRVEEHPDAVWLKFRDETYAWSEVLSNIQRAANGLLELGVRPGERVALLMANRPEFIWVHLGIIFIGASVPVNTSQRGATLAHILADSDSAVVVFEDELRDAVLAVTDSLPAAAHLRRARRKVGRRRRLDRRPADGRRRRRAGGRARGAERRRGDDVHLGHDRPAQGRGGATKYDTSPLQYDPRTPPA